MKTVLLLTFQKEYYELFLAVGGNGGQENQVVF
jgi:hypothetical protein